jgi:hypothetical protein
MLLTIYTHIYKAWVSCLATASERAMVPAQHAIQCAPWVLSWGVGVKEARTLNYSLAAI